MAVSRGERLRKAAAKAAKRKVVAAERLAQGRRESGISKLRHIDMAKSPIRACLITRDTFGRGIGTLVVARDLPFGRVGVGGFLLDLWCLGVKDAYFRVVSGADFEGIVGHLYQETGKEDMAPSAARRLVAAAVDYAASLGFPPHPSSTSIEIHQW